MTKKKMETKKIQSSITKNGRRYIVGISQDKNGFFAHTHRARSKSYAKKTDIPASVLKFIEGTG